MELLGIVLNSFAMGFFAVHATDDWQRGRVMWAAIGCGFTLANFACVWLQAVQLWNS